ncbi:hypothetical protein PG990_012178 [Apiospora arundinis]
MVLAALENGSSGIQQRITVQTVLFSPPWPPSEQELVENGQRWSPKGQREGHFFAVSSSAAQDSAAHERYAAWGCPTQILGQPGHQRGIQSITTPLS